MPRKQSVRARDKKGNAALLKQIRVQLDLSQEELAHELGVSFATVNRWENGVVQPSRLAKAQLNAFCAKMTDQGKLKLSGFF